MLKIKFKKVLIQFLSKNYFLKKYLLNLNNNL
jgi:hypothetical protein